ncbi:MAG: transglutaminase-like domain-containing protein [Terrimicrobiaceae bacterium]|nr:transglutaminase-like domain-containing protein [Terrimicrobiaceae bacterium]
MMIGQKEAIVRLLQDNDPETVRLVKEQLAAVGEDARDDLASLAEFEDERVSRHAREVLDLIADREAEDEFTLLCHLFGDHHDLERANWMLGRALIPGIDFTPLETKVNAWGRRFLLKSSGAVSSRERVLLLANFMSGELGFRGNTEDYYSEKNCLLPCVIESRLGIPITLTLLYMMVAARAGMCVEGINLPGHFIARHGDLYFDPFHRGRILTKADCVSILAKQHLSLQKTHLADATARQILVRVLANLLYVFDLKHDLDNHSKVNAWIRALTADCC